MRRVLDSAEGTMSTAVTGAALPSRRGCPIVRVGWTRGRSHRAPGRGGGDSSIERSPSPEGPGVCVLPSSQALEVDVEDEQS